MRRGKQVYYHESSDEEEHELANLTDSAEEIKHDTDEEGDYIQTGFVEEEDILKPDISQILTWRTEKAIPGSFDSCNNNLFLLIFIDIVEDCEFLVKFKNYSYHNLEWMNYSELDIYNKRASMKLKRFIQTHKRNNLLPYLK